MGTHNLQKKLKKLGKLNSTRPSDEDPRFEYATAKYLGVLVNPTRVAAEHFSVPYISIKKFNRVDFPPSSPNIKDDQGGKNGSRNPLSTRAGHIHRGQPTPTGLRGPAVHHGPERLRVVLGAAGGLQHLVLGLQLLLQSRRFALLLPLLPFHPRWSRPPPHPCSCCSCSFFLFHAVNTSN